MNKILGCTLGLLLAGCADRPIHVVVDNEVATRVTNPEQLIPSQQTVDKVEKVDYLGQPVGRIADQLEQGLKQKGIKRLPIAITGFVDLSKPQPARPLGDEIAEGFFHELQQRGFNLVDHRAQPFGDRDNNELSTSDYYRQYRISYVLGGTYIINSSGVTLNARIVDTVSRQVVATGQSQFAIDQLEGDFPGYDPLSSRDGMIIENSGVPAQ